VIFVVQDFFCSVVRRFDQLELDEGSTVIDASEAENVERRECLREERVSYRVEVRHLRGIHLRVERHEKVEIGLVEEVKVFESRRRGLKILDQIVEGRFRDGIRGEIERDGTERGVHRCEESLVKGGSISEGEFAESELFERKRDGSRISGIFEVGFAAQVRDT
jgi:hypothetical protein